jgi:hypothetical protein
MDLGARDKIVELCMMNNIGLIIKSEIYPD